MATKTATKFVMGFKEYLYELNNATTDNRVLLLSKRITNSRVLNAEQKEQLSIHVQSRFGELERVKFQ